MGSRSGDLRQWGKYGSRFATELSKNIIANRGNLAKVDMFDVMISTVNPLSKYNSKVGELITGVSTELVKSAIDVKYEGSGMILNETKDLGKFGIDMLFGFTKTSLKEGFNSAVGSDVVRDAAVDVVSDQLKNESKSFYEKNQGFFQ